MSHTSPWGVHTTIWAQKEHQSDTHDLWRYWWEGSSDPSVSEGPGHWECLPPTKTKIHKSKAMSYGIQILKCTRIRQSEMWARRYGNWVRRCLGTTSRNRSDLGVRLGLRGLKITSSILTWMGQVMSLSISMQKWMSTEWLFIRFKYYT